MPVAPSFENFKQISAEPFIKNGKTYITVENPKNGNRRDVRWYTDAEYAKSYGKKVLDTSKGFKNLKRVRGFSEGPILVIRRNRPEDEEWLRASIARYAVGIGWYINSDSVFLKDAPEHFKYLLLGWNEFRDGDDCHMKKPEVIAEILDKKAQNREWVAING